MSQRKNPFKDLEGLEDRAQTLAKIIHDHPELPLSPSIPPGCKAIIVKQEFSPETLNQVNEIVHELSKIKAVQTTAEAESANVAINRASKFLKNFESERVLMTSVLDQEKKILMNLQKSIADPIESTLAVVRTAVTQFQKMEAQRIANENAKIERDKQEKFAKEQKEIKEKAEHKANLIKLESALMKDALLSDIKALNLRIAAWELTDWLTEKLFGEHISEANNILVKGIVALQDRKAKLMTAPSICAAHDKATEIALAELDQKAQAIEEEKGEAIQSAALNIQMDAELKQAQIGKQKGIAKVWVFDEVEIDLSLLPLEFHTFDKAKIKAAIAAGRTEIPGVNIYQEIRNVAR